MIPISMNPGQSFTISVSPVPAVGVLDAPPTYTSTTPGVLSIIPAADGLSAVVKALVPGSDTISVKALSLGNPIVGDDTVVVTVVPVPVPATALHVSVSAIS